MADQNFLTISAYQLRNLLSNRVAFQYLDLSASAVDGVPADLLRTSQKVPAAAVLTHLKDLSATPDTPIVLICETGANSVVVAQALQDNSFINVFVVAGGMQGLK